LLGDDWKRPGLGLLLFPGEKTGTVISSAIVGEGIGTWAARTIFSLALALDELGEGACSIYRPGALVFPIHVAFESSRHADRCELQTAKEEVEIRRT
jgi:hypothetical protein